MRAVGSFHLGVDLAEAPTVGVDNIAARRQIPARKNTCRHRCYETGISHDTWALVSDINRTL